MNDFDNGFLEVRREVRRGQIYYVEKSPSAFSVGTEVYPGRPAIIVSNDKANTFSSTVEVVYMTTQPKKDLPTHVVIRSGKKNSVALCEQIHSVSKDRLGSYFGECSEPEMRQVDVALQISLGINFHQNEIPHPAKTDSNAELEKMQTERDLYKKMYEGLLKEVLQRADV